MHPICKIVRSFWGYKCYFSNHNSQSVGLAILVNNDFDFKVVKTEADNNDNLIELDFLSYEQKISLFCAHGPNNDNSGFYEVLVLRDRLITIDNPCILVDFNPVLDPEKDYQNSENINNPRARQTVLDLNLECDLFDCWREEHIEELKYTWLRKNPLKQARLDVLLFSGSLFF